jgi:hypothetical protein
VIFFSHGCVTSILRHRGGGGGEGEESKPKIKKRETTSFVKKKKIVDMALIERSAFAEGAATPSSDQQLYIHTFGLLCRKTVSLQGRGRGLVSVATAFRFFRNMCVAPSATTSR